MKSLLNDFKKVSKSIIFLHCKKSLKQKFEAEVKEEFVQCSSQDELFNTISSNNGIPIKSVYNKRGKLLNYFFI